jgi:hypothetical protein
MTSVRRQIVRAKEEWNDVERRIRQKMRLYPQKHRYRLAEPVHESELSDITAQMASEDTAESKTQPIISVNGRDVDEKELTKHGV